jgi:galactokinase/mevalonate kinase-like predicted kinase
LEFRSLGLRYDGFDVLDDTILDAEHAKVLIVAADEHWDAILRQDIVAFGRTMHEGFEAQVAMFPHMMTNQVAKLIEEYRAIGWKLSGAGGGEYLIRVSEKSIPGAVRVLARREME